MPIRGWWLVVLPLKVGGNATQGLVVLPLEVGDKASQGLVVLLLGLFGITFLRAVFEVKPLELLYDQVVRTGQLRKFFANLIRGGYTLRAFEVDRVDLDAFRLLCHSEDVKEVQ